MEFGTVLTWTDQKTFLRRVETAEQLGYSYIGVGDSGDVYVSLTLASLTTSAVLLGPMVTVPCGRHPALVASALSTLQRISGGRMRYGVGRGGSTTMLMGRSPTTLAETRAYLLALKALLRGEATMWEGTSLPAPHSASHVPIYLSAYGPAVRRLAGEVADGVILATGVSDDSGSPSGGCGFDTVSLGRGATSVVDHQPTRGGTRGEFQ